MSIFYTIRTMREAGATYQQISEAVGRPKPYVRTALYQMRTGRALGKKPPRRLTREQQEEIVRQAHAGVKIKDIAASVGCAYDTARLVILRARRAGEPIAFRRRVGRPIKSNGHKLHVPVALMTDLDELAKARGITPQDLARDILTTVVEDNLINAVLGKV